MISYTIFLQMVILYKDPKGEKIFERTYSVSQTGGNQDEDLERHCRELEERLGRYEVSKSAECRVCTRL